MPLPVLDVRPLQEAHAARGVGSFVTSLLEALPFDEVLTWADLPAPVLPPSTKVLEVTGSPAPGRVGWVRDVARSRRHVPARRVHVPLLDVRLAGPDPAVLSVHDAIPWRFPDLYPAGRIGAARRALDRSLARRADVVVTLSEASAADLCALLGVREERIRVVPLFLRAGWPDPAGADGRVRDEERRHGRRYVVAAGGFRDRDPRKRLPDLLYALARLTDDVGLVVTGSRGPHEQAFLDEARRVGVAERVELTGQLPLVELVEVFARAAAFAFPSAWEGFGLPLLEAMSVGLPCVVSDGGALAEVAGDAATVVPVGDVGALAEALEELLGDPARARAASRRATARAAVYTREAFADGYLRVYG